MKITNSKQLSVYLKDVRLGLSKTQGQVGRSVGIRQDTVSKFEISSDTAKMDTFFKMLAALNLEIEISPRNDTGGAAGGQQAKGLGKQSQEGVVSSDDDKPIWTEDW